MCVGPTRAPTGVRAPARSRHPSPASLRLYPRPPFRLDLTAWALRRRVQNRIDHWDGRTYRRALTIDGRLVELAVTQGGDSDKPWVDLAFSGARLTAARAATVTDVLTTLLGLDVDLSGFYARAAADRALGRLAQRYRGLKPPRFPTLFECLLNAVACQQVSLAAGLTVLTRLAEAVAPVGGAPHPFPAPLAVLHLSPSDLRELGFSQRKAHTILELAHAAADGELDPDRFTPLDDDEVVGRLMQRPGIGRWSAEYVLLRGLGRLHVFPPTDVGALNGLRRFLAASGLDDDPARALARWHSDAGVLYFHLLLRDLDERGALDSGVRR